MLLSSTALRLGIFIALQLLLVVGGRQPRLMYVNETCSKSAFFQAKITLEKRDRSSLRQTTRPLIKLFVGQVKDGRAVELAQMELQLGSTAQKAICLRKEAQYFVASPDPYPGHVLTICGLGLVQLQPQQEVPVVLVTGANQPGGNLELSPCVGEVSRDEKTRNAVHHTLANRKSAMDEPAFMPTSMPTACQEEPTSSPTSVPTLAVLLGNGTNGAERSVFESTTFISSVTAAGGAGVVTAASASYYFLRTARNFVKVPMAPSNLAMQI